MPLETLTKKSRFWTTPILVRYCQDRLNSWIPSESSGALRDFKKNAQPFYPQVLRQNICLIRIDSAKLFETLARNHSHSIVSSTCKCLKIRALAIYRLIFTVRSTVRKCCLGAINPDRSRKVHAPRGAKPDAAATIVRIECLHGARSGQMRAIAFWPRLATRRPFRQSPCSVTEPLDDKGAPLC